MLKFDNLGSRLLNLPHCLDGYRFEEADFFIGRYTEATVNKIQKIIYHMTLQLLLFGG